MLRPHKYQEDAVQFMLNNPKSYLALDMGLGKTAITLTWIKKILPEVKAVLVFAPLRTVYSSWPEEIKKWAPDLTYTILHGKDKDENFHKKVNVYLINYEGVAWLFDMLKRYFKITGTVPFRALVLDEGSMVKSSSTKRFKTLKKMCDLFPKYRTVLSGTPAPNSLLDLWSQYFILDNGERLGKFITNYKRQYFYQVDRMGFIWSINKGSKDQIYKCIEDITYRLDAEDYIKLPKRIDNEIKIKLTKKELKAYKDLENEFFLEIESNDIEVFNAPALAMKLRQYVQGALYTDPAGTITGQPRPYVIVHKHKLNMLSNLIDEANG